MCFCGSLRIWRNRFSLWQECLEKTWEHESRSSHGAIYHSSFKKHPWICKLAFTNLLSAVILHRGRVHDKCCFACLFVLQGESKQYSADVKASWKLPLDAKTMPANQAISVDYYRTFNEGTMSAVYTSWKGIACWCFMLYIFIVSNSMLNSMEEISAYDSILCSPDSGVYVGRSFKFFICIILVSENETA